MQSREEYLEYQRQYRIAHREEIRAKDRVRYQKNKEYHREYHKGYSKQYYEKNRDKIRQYHKERYVPKQNEVLDPTSDNVLEVWKDINEEYSVSNYGKVWSKMNNRFIGHKLKNGYIQVMINGKHYYVHRLVAEAFIPNPDNLPEIDHLDTDPANNVWTNLRWTDRKGNQNNPFTKRKMKESNKGKTKEANNATRKRVLQYTIDGVFIKEYPSTVAAGKEVGVYSTGIAACCRGKCKTIKGFVWKYAS